MAKRYLPDDLFLSLRSNAVGISVFLIGAVSFVIASVVVLGSFDRKLETMAGSSWVSPKQDLEQPYVTGQRYDVSDKGVGIPPSREERRSAADGKDAAHRAKYYARDCYRQAYTSEESDLCAQWASAATARYGNLIALESLRLNSWVGFLTALGIFLGSVGVIFAGTASIHSSRSLAMMAYGFAPVLSFSAQQLGRGRIRLTIRNAGTGPASDIRVTVGGERIDVQQDRLGSTAHTTVDISADAGVLKVDAVCLDLARKARAFHQEFVKSNGEWVVADIQPNKGDQ